MHPAILSAWFIYNYNVSEFKFFKTARQACIESKKGDEVYRLDLNTWTFTPSISAVECVKI